MKLRSDESLKVTFNPDHAYEYRVTVRYVVDGVPWVDGISEPTARKAVRRGYKGLRAARKANRALKRINGAQA